MTATNLPSIDEIRDNFSFLDDWEDRYKYLIDLGRALPPYPEHQRDTAHLVRGCASQVWLSTQKRTSDQGTQLLFLADSDAHIVRGLIALLLAIYNGRSPQEIIDLDADKIFDDFQLGAHLTMQRANGLAAMRQRIRAEAEKAATSA